MSFICKSSASQVRQCPNSIRGEIAENLGFLAKSAQTKIGCVKKSWIKAQLALRHILVSGLKMRIFPAQKKLDLATENTLHNILEQPIFLTVILIGSLHMPS